MGRKWWKDRFKGICNVEEQYNFYFNYLLGKVNSLFVWEGLPSSIDVEFLNTTLNLNGIVAVFHNSDTGELLALDCGYGGSPDKYYRPEKLIVANPVIGSRELTRDIDAIALYNSSTDCWNPQGLRQLIETYATLMADNIVSINTAQINTRVNTLFVADSAALKNSGEIVLKQLYSGKPYTIVEQDLVDNLHITPLATTGVSTTITELVELNNYILANFYKSLGIYVNDVRKKERLITDEVEVQENQCGFNVYDMLDQRVKGVEKINEMFGTDIRVSLNPIVPNMYTTFGTEDGEEAIDVQAEAALEPFEKNNTEEETTETEEETTETEEETTETEEETTETEEET